MQSNKVIFLIKFSLLVCCLFITKLSSAQLTVTSGQPATVLATALAGPGVTTFGATLTCPAMSNGTFTSTGTLLSMSSGIVLTNGKASACAGAEGPLVSWNSGGGTDPAMIPFLPTGTAIVDACILEFNIVATGDTLSFNYQFGSEEYRNAVCSIYTDVFAFFISGPGITGTPNMALIPGTNIPVEINSINNGTPGTVGGANIANCNSLGAGSPFTSYYLDNTGGTYLTYRGYTKKLRAFHSVTPCDTYHLKLSIVDAGNWQYDSGVFLEGGSLNTGSFHFNHADSIGATINGVPHTIVKGCNSTTITVMSSQVLGTAHTIHLTYGGTGVHGTDYTAPDSVSILAGDSTVTFSVAGIPTPPGGTKTAVIYLASGCGTTDSVVINILDTPFAHILTPDTSICGTSVLIRTTGSTGLTYLWTPATGLSSATVAQPTATPATTTTYTMTATLPGSGCPPIVRTVTISVGSVGISMITPDTTICLGNSVDILVGGSSTFTYSWTPSTGLSSTTAQDPIATPTVTTTYSVTASLPGSGCAPSTQHITITVVTIADSILTPDTTICAGSSFTIRTTGTPGITYSWSPATGLSSPTVAEPVASPVVTTSYVLTGSMPGCPSIVRTINVTVESTNIAMLTHDTTLCQGGIPINLDVSGSATYNYSWSPAGSLNNANIQNPTATPTSTTTYVVTATLPGGLCPSTASVTVTILGIAPISIITTNKSICVGDSVKLLVNGNPALVYSWSPAAGLNNASIMEPTATPTVTTTYVVTAVTTAGLCASSASVTINVGNVTASINTPDTGICQGQSVQLSVNGDPSYLYSWIPVAGLNNPNTMDPVATPGTTTTYTFTATNMASGGCIASGAVTITVTPKVSPWLKQPIVEYCQNYVPDSITTYVYGQDLVWYNAFYDTLGSTTPPTINTENLGTYFYYVSQDINNCNSLKTTIVVNIIPCCDGPIFIPTSFTPNNDGLNDYFTIKRPPHMAIDEFKIFNRWGNMVFSGDGTNDKWDGTYMGIPCDMGTYYYLIQLNCADVSKPKIRKGDITLIR